MDYELIVITLILQRETKPETSCLTCSLYSFRTPPLFLLCNVILCAEVVVVGLRGGGVRGNVI